MPEQRLDRVIRNAEYLKTFKISRSTRDRLENQGILPKRFKLNPSGKAVGWWESELIDAQERMKRKNAASHRDSLPRSPGFSHSNSL